MLRSDQLSGEVDLLIRFHVSESQDKSAASHCTESRQSHQAEQAVYEEHLPPQKENDSLFFKRTCQQTIKYYAINDKI